LAPPRHRLAGLDAQLPGDTSSSLEPPDYSATVELASANQDATSVARPDVPEQLLAEHAVDASGGVEVADGIGAAEAGVRRPAPDPRATEDVGALPIDPLIDRTDGTCLASGELGEVERSVKVAPRPGCGRRLRDSQDQRKGQ
jgi:hypothetical protein